MNNSYLDKWSYYTKNPISWEDYTPRDISDNRKRVRRETARGKLTFFHENLEEYLTRQVKAHTTTRAFLHFALAGVFAVNSSFLI